MDDLDIDDNLGTVPHLLDLAAQTVGKCLSPLVIIDRTLDESLFKKVLYHAFPESNNAALFMKTLSKDGTAYDETNITSLQSALRSITQVGFMLIAEFTTNPVIRVTVEFAKQLITAATCSSCCNTYGCIHVYVTVLSRVQKGSDVVIHAPLTESLVSMDKSRLESLMYKTIHKDPGYLLDLLQQCNVEDHTDSSEQIHDPTVSGGRGEELLGHALEVYLKQTDENIIFTAGTYDWKQRWQMHNYMKKCVEMSKVSPWLPLALLYMTGVGRKVAGPSSSSYFLFRGAPDDNAHLFLHDLNVYSASVFPQRHNPVTIDNIDVVLWKKVVNDSQKFFEAYNTYKFILRCSPWVELPRIYPLYEDKVKEVFGLDRQELSQGYFSEALASLFIPPPPQEFDDLVNGRTSPLNSSYNEPLAVMMARANAYMFNEPLERSWESPTDNRHRFTNENKRHAEEQLRLVDYILIKLAKIGLKYSILSIVGKTINIESLDVHRDKPFLKFIIENSRGIQLTKKPPKQEPSKPTSEQASSFADNTSRKRKPQHVTDHKTETSYKRRRSGRLEKKTQQNQEEDKQQRECESGEQEPEGAPKKPDVSPPEPEVGPVYPVYNITETYVSPDPISPGQGLTKGQLAYCLLYWLIRRDELADDKPNDDIMVGINLLALELSRWSITTKRRAPYTKELSLLESMDNMVKCIPWNHLDKWGNARAFSFLYIHWLYISAWWTLGFDFYGDHIPFVLGGHVFDGSNFIEYSERGHFGTPHYKTVLELLMCRFLWFEEKNLYTFTKKGLGPYSPLEDEIPLRRYPLESTYKALCDDYLTKKQKGHKTAVFYKMQEVVDNCFTTSVKSIPRAMWRALKKHIYFGSIKFREAMLMGDFMGLVYKPEEHKLMFKLSIYLCDVYSSRTSEPYATPDKYARTLIASLKTLGVQHLGHLQDSFGDKKWTHYLSYVHMDCILRFFVGNVLDMDQRIQDLFYSYVLDVCKVQQLSPAFEEYKSVKLWRFVFDNEVYPGTSSELLGVKTGKACTDVLKYLDKLGGVKRDVSELKMKCMNVLVCHVECEACKGSLMKLLTEGKFTAAHISFLIDEIIECVGTIGNHGNTNIYALLKVLKTIKVSPSLQAKIMSDKLVVWILQNTSNKIWKQLGKTQDSGNIVSFIESEYRAFLDNVDLDMGIKKRKFKEMVEKRRNYDDNWSESKWKRSLVVAINKVLV